MDNSPLLFIWGRGLQQARPTPCPRAHMMINFTLEKVTSSGVRVGLLSKDGVSMATPLCLPHTRRGVTPFLTPDIVNDIQFRPQAAMLTLSTL